MFNIALVLYCIVAIAVIAGGSFQLYGSSQGIAAIIFFIGSLVSFIVFGIKWFSGKNSMLSSTPVSWPPTINTCPDYLMFYERKLADGSTENTCVDTIGVSRNGALKVFPTNGDVPTDNDYYFSLTTKNSDGPTRNNELCQRAITAGLTWEGITNGESCITPEGPVAPGSSPSTPGSNGCPAFS